MQGRVELENAMQEARRDAMHDNAKSEKLLVNFKI